MHFVEQQFDDVYVLSIKGKLTDSPETDELHARIESFLNRQIKKIVIDLKHVNLLASAGIGALMRCLTTVRNAGGELKFAGLSDKVRSIFAITRLNGVLPVYDTVNAAVHSYADTY
jgi:anti-sigma B factor antagonist